MAFRVHADVLKMAKAEEQRERIKWFHARRVFIMSSAATSLAEGLALAKQSQHEDAQFLVSLFREREPQTRKEAAEVFLARADDPRCACWAAQCLTMCDAADYNNLYWPLVTWSANGGYACGQALLAQRGGESSVAWLEKAASQKDPLALQWLAYTVWKHGQGVDVLRAMRLYREAAELGEPEAQNKLGQKFMPSDSVECFQWLRRAAMQSSESALLYLVGFVTEKLRGYDDNVEGSGRICLKLAQQLRVSISGAKRPIVRNFLTRLGRVKGCSIADCRFGLG